MQRMNETIKNSLLYNGVLYFLYVQKIPLNFLLGDFFGIPSDDHRWHTRDTRGLCAPIRLLNIIRLLSIISKIIEATQKRRAFNDRIMFSHSHRLPNFTRTIHECLYSIGHQNLIS